jgi:hypothetical protein
MTSEELAAIVDPAGTLGLLTAGQRHVLAALTATTGPMSGRRVATAADMAPTTAIKYLSELATLGLVTAVPKGRAMEWQIDGTLAVCERCHGAGIALG